MKRLFLIVISLCITMLMQAQVYKTVTATAGGLSAALTPTELSTVTNLTVTGTIDARDFKTMRDNMPVLAVLDLSNVQITDYVGTEGTNTGIDAYRVNRIPVYAFVNRNTGIGKTSLTSVILPKSVTYIDSGAFANCSGLTSVKLPQSISFIGISAFQNCTGLTSIAIPIAVYSMGEKAFSGCSSLTSIIAQGITPPTFYFGNWRDIFFAVNKNTCTLYVPYKKSGLYAAADQWKDFTNIVEMPGYSLSSSEVTIVPPGSTASVAITSNVKWSAVSNRSWLTLTPTSFTGNDTLIISAQANSSVATRIAVVTISSPEVVSQTIIVNQFGVLKTLEVSAGGLFSALTTFELSSITRLKLSGTIDARDFKTIRDNMPELTELDLSEVTIVAYTGSEGTSSGNYVYPSNATPNMAFYYKYKSLTSVVLPSSVTAIGNNSFYNCTRLKSISIPPYVTSIGDNAFYNCTHLTAINIPSSVTYIGMGAFMYCLGLTSVTIPSSITKIPASTFSNCYGLTSVTIPSSVTYIGYGAFQQSSITSITIPKSVTYIGNYALAICSNLRSIYAYGDTPVDLSSYDEVFTGTSMWTCTLYVPYGTSALYRAANQWRDFTNIVEMPAMGSIASSQTICTGATPAPLTSIAPGVGQGTISYRWEFSYDGTSWLPTGTSAETYAPGALIQTTMFRRITISTANGTSWESAPTEPVTISVTANSTITLSSAVGTDAQILCANTAITNITYTTTVATGATFSGLPDGVTGAWDSNMITISGIPSTSGTFNYTVALTGCGAITKTGSIIVNTFTPTVTINVSQNNVDAGTPVTFTAIPVGGGATPTYKWILNNVAVATGPGGTYVPRNGDVIYAQMTSNLACSAGTIATSNTITMVVNPVPVVSSVSISTSQNNVCPGTPVTLTANPVNGGSTPTYRWYLNNVAVATGTGGTYVPTNGDAVYVVMTSSLPNVTGSPSTSNVITMVVGSPAALPGYFTEGMAYVTPGLSDIRYTVPYVANMTYSWSYSGTGATITGTSNSVLISFSATATSGTLSVTASNNCGTSNPRSGNITVGNTLKAGLISDVVEHAPIDVPSAKNELKVYPNPASGPVTFEFQINEDAKATLDLLSMTGQRIARIFDAEAQAAITQTVVYGEPLPTGVYLYMLRWKDQTITGKLIITK